jgi:signal transduction histidine kinase
MSWRWFAALLPLGLGLAVKALASLGRIGNPILYLRGDMGAVAALVGILLSAVLLLFVWSGHRSRSRLRRNMAEVQQRAAEDHRRFLRRLDHELKNPLTAIRAGLANLADVCPEEARQGTLPSLEAQVLRLSQLSSDLRKLAELETQSLESTSVDMTTLLREAFAIIQEQPGSASRPLTLTLPQAPWPLPHVRGDPDLLFLAIHNLLSNALKFTRPGDRVEVRGLEDGASVVVEVADTGPGIPEEEIPYVWEELYRGQGARGIPGSGLGLALVRTIVERHGGRVTLRSRHGQGTVFALRLPTG